MRQPKFKFGDKVTVPDSGNVFSVATIYYNESYDDYVYDGKNQDGAYISVEEDELELYQEPIKNKLYAYSDLGGMIYFSVFELPEQKHKWRRAEQFDIMFPVRVTQSYGGDA